jgi:hypothetical protein
MLKKNRPLTLATFIIVLIFDVVFIVVPLLQIQNRVKWFIIWPSMFAGSAALTAMTLMILVFGKTGEDFLVITDPNNISWKQVIGVGILLIVGFVSFFTFASYLESVGYK